MLYNVMEVEAIKLSVKNLEKLNISSKETLLRSIEHLEKNYLQHKKEEYLVKAIWHIYAYLELGFFYEEGKNLFEKILKHSDISIGELVPDTRWKCQSVNLNKTNVRNILGRWNPVLHSMKLEDAVKDIITKISTREEGEYLYYCGRIIDDTKDRILWEHMFKLYVNRKGSFLFDVNKNKYFVFKER